MECIVQGALRLAAHQVLGEKPHLGGKYSQRLIEDGIALIEQAKEPAAPLKPSPKKAAADKQTRIFGDRLRGSPAPAKKKPWSSRDSRSWRDPKPDE